MQKQDGPEVYTLRPRRISVILRFHAESQRYADGPRINTQLGVVLSPLTYVSSRDYSTEEDWMLASTAPEIEWWGAKRVISGQLPFLGSEKPIYTFPK
jgi:hypothetical protein